MQFRYSLAAARVLWLLLASGVFGASVALAWVACSNPLELEMREGSVWLAVLASRAGVDIYDHFQVAFVNMAHGPLDPVLKTWISQCLPFLPGHIVVRAFVLMCPFFFLGTAFAILGGRIVSALLCAGALYLFLTDVSLFLMVGRSDATALCGLCVAGVLTHQLLENPHWAWFQRPYVLRQIGLGAASSVVFLTLSRYLPPVAAFQFVVIAARLSRSGPLQAYPALKRRFGQRVRFILEEVSMGSLLFLGGFALVWGLTFVFELNGDFDLYYDHFFGFFSPESGWGTFPGAKFELFPTSLVQGRLAPFSVLVALLLLACSRLRKSRLELAGWITMLLLLWGTLAYTYHKNQGGGGLHYFFAFFLFAWVFLLHALGKRKRFRVPIGVASFAAILLALPWKALLGHYELANERRSEALDFMAKVEEITQGEPIFGESTHLFKTRYRGEVVDSGDTVHAIASRAYFGAIFLYTYQQYVEQLTRSPPRFVLEAVTSEGAFRGITTPTLHGLLNRRYRRVLIVRGSAFTYGGSQALYELRQPGRARQQPARAPNRRAK